MLETSVDKVRKIMGKERNRKEMVRLSPEGIVYFSLTLSDPFHRTKGNLKEAERNYTLLGNNCVTTEYLGAGIVVRELRIKNV